MAKEHTVVGKKIVKVRPMTTEEAENQGWSDTPRFATVLVLSDKSLLFASQDDEGNGPGTLFGEQSNGEQFCLISCPKD